MDYIVPGPSIPTANAHLSPTLRAIDQWTRLTIGSMVAFTAVAPALRAISLRMAETEHRRQHRFVPPPEGPYLPFSSTWSAFRQTWAQEGFRGFFRGMSVLYATAPFRAAYHLLLFNYIEQQHAKPTAPPSPLTSDTGFILMNTDTSEKSGPHGNNFQNANGRARRHPLPPVEAYTRQDRSRPSFMLKCLGIIMAGELFLYPSRYLFLRLSGDLLGDERTIDLRRPISLLRQVVQREGVLALYRGFWPCLLAVSVPALIYANHRYTSLNPSKPRNEPSDKRDSATQVPEIDMSSVKNELTTLEAAKLILAQDRTGKLNLVDALSMARIQKDEGLPRLWFLATIVMYPFLNAHVRMAVADESRAANPNVLRRFPVERFPRMRALMGELFPSTSVSYSSNLHHTMRRLGLPGAVSLFAAFWAALIARQVFDGVSNFVAELCAAPLNFYLNHSELGIASAYSLSYNKALLTYQASMESQRAQVWDEIYDQVLRSSTHNPDSTDSSNAVQLANFVDEIDTHHDRYGDGDEALEALGLTPVLRPGDEFYLESNIKQMVSRRDPLEHLQLEDLLVEKPSHRSTVVKVDAVPATEPQATKSDESKQSADDVATEKPLPNATPLLSQPQPWFAQFDPSSSKRQL